MVLIFLPPANGLSLTCLLHPLCSFHFHDGFFLPSFSSLSLLSINLQINEFHFGISLLLISPFTSGAAIKVYNKRNVYSFLIL